MDRRRTSNRTKMGDNPTNSKSPARKVKQQSPSRERKSSPARASKKNEAQQQKSPVKKTSENAPAAKRTKSTSTPTMLSSEVLKDIGDMKRLSPMVVLKPFDNSTKNQTNMKTFSEHSIQSSVSETNTIKTSRTVETVDIGTIRADDLLEGDSEIAKLTSLAAFVRRSVSVTKNLTPRHQLTPTPSATTGRSRHSQSRSISRSVYDDDYSKTEYSDNEQDNFESFKTNFVASSYGRMPKGMPTMRKEAKFTATIAAVVISLLLITLPTLGYYLLWTCDQSCTLKALKLTVPKLEHVKEIFTVEKVGYYLGMTVLVQIFSMFPLGRVVNFYNNWGSVEYYFNSFAVGTLMTIAFGVAEYLQYPVADFVMQNYLSLYLFGVLHAFILSLWCFVHSWYVHPASLNPYAKSGSAPVDFAIGREVNPHWFNTINVKLVCYRTSLLVVLLLSEIFIYKNVNIPINVDSEGEGLPLEFYQKAKLIYENSSFDAAGLLTSVLLLTYVLDQIVFEHHLTSSFELQEEGVGAILLVRYAMTPFLLAAIPKFFFDNKGIDLPHWAMAVTAIVFLLGLFLKRKSNSVKYTYRMYPQSLKQAYQDTVPTFQGRRLLLGKYWGRLRQPNYAGDVLSLTAFAIPLFWKFSWPPLICLLLIVLNLFHRAVRVNKRNQARYESAWTRYCSKARYIIIPRIF